MTIGNNLKLGKLEIRLTRYNIHGSLRSQQPFHKMLLLITFLTILISNISNIGKIPTVRYLKDELVHKSRIAL